VVSAPSVARELDQQEQLYFQHFMKDTSGFLHRNDLFYWKDVSTQEAGHFTSIQNYDPFFWKVVALQESHSSTCVRHVIVAIGALGKSVQTSSLGHHHMDTSQGSHREFALQQYQKAIRGLRESIANSDHEVDTRTTLISCLVLACFDNFIGNGGFALQHIRYARDILYKSNPSRTPHTTTSPETPTDYLSSMFLRLDMQALFSMGVDPDRTFIALQVNTPKISIPVQFASLEEVKDFGNAIILEGYYFHYLTSFYKFAPGGSIPEEVVQQRDCLIEQINTFHARVDSLLQQMIHIPRDPLIHPLMRPEAVKIYSSALLIRLTSSLDARETDCDPLLPHFEYLLSIMRDTVEYEAKVTSGRPLSSMWKQSLTRRPGGETFTFEVRTIAQLSLIATKCRHPAIRREAIALLLSSHRREWMFDSLLAGQVGAWMMGLEEERRAECGNIPEHARAWGECMMLDLQTRRAVVRCRQNVKEGGWRERETVITW
jgi:hypothetical protein